MSSSLPIKVARAAVGFGVVSSVLKCSVYTVGEGERAVVFNRFGVRTDKDKSVGEGIHLLIPWLQKAFVFDTRTRPHTFSSVFYTKDLQKVETTVRILFHPDIYHLPEACIHQNPEEVLPSIGYEILNAVISKFSADQLLTNRFHVSALMLEALAPRAKEFNIILDELSLVNLSFSPEFFSAFQRKLKSQQEVERAKMLVEKAEQKGASFMKDEAEGNLLLFWMRMFRAVSSDKSSSNESSAGKF